MGPVAGGTRQFISYCPTLSIPRPKRGPPIPYDTPQGEYLAVTGLGEALERRGEVVMLSVRIAALSAALQIQNRAEVLSSRTEG